MSELTIKQENFCQKYIELGNASEAYRQSYDVSPDCAKETIWVNSCKLLSDANVSQRVKELQQLAQEVHLVTVGTITAELEEARGIAKQEKQPAPMISASMGKAKLHGLAADKHEIKAVIETKEPSAVEFARRAAFLFAQASKELENGNQRTDDGIHGEKDPGNEVTKENAYEKNSDGNGQKA